MGASRSSRSATASAASKPPPDLTSSGVTVSLDAGSLDPGQRARLLHAKLRGLVGAASCFDVGPDELRPATFPGGSALLAAETAWVLVDERPARSLGAVLAWADRHDIANLHLLADDAAGVLARRAACFDRSVAVWRVDGAQVERAGLESIVVTSAPPERALDLVGTLRQADLDIVIEHGEVRGEILGLEVARVVVDGGDARIEVGVGRHDREAFAMLHGDVPTPDALASVVAHVRERRRPGDLTHPLARLAPERWLRDIVLHNPQLVGAEHLDAVEPTLRPQSMKDPEPAAAVGRAADGAPLVVACSVGVDLDLVPSAADARLAAAPGARLRVVVPERDAHPVTRRLAAALLEPAELITVPDDFRR